MRGAPDVRRPNAHKNKLWIQGGTITGAMFVLRSVSNWGKNLVLKGWKQNKEAETEWYYA
jgi:hypothetical protein